MLQVFVDSDLAGQPALRCGSRKGIEHIKLRIVGFTYLFGALFYFNMARGAQGHATAGSLNGVTRRTQYFHQVQIDVVRYFDGLYVPLLILYTEYNHG